MKLHGHLNTISWDKIQITMACREEIIGYKYDQIIWNKLDSGILPNLTNHSMSLDANNYIIYIFGG